MEAATPAEKTKVGRLHPVEPPTAQLRLAAAGQHLVEDVVVALARGLRHHPHFLQLEKTWFFNQQSNAY